MKKEYLKAPFYKDNTKTLKYLKTICKTVENSKNQIQDKKTISRILKYNSDINIKI